MTKYEAMFIVKPDLSEEEKKNLFNQIKEAVTKDNIEVTQAAVWSEKRKLYFPLKKYREGIYYLLNFTVGDTAPGVISEITRAYKLNENILRVLITKIA
jgi:small subunit ribosomal protein S6